MNTTEAARGKWRGILLAMGVDGNRFLGGKHGPCPFCEGTDRFRWDNSEGKGSFICSQCGAGDGFEFLKRLKGWDFKTAAREVDKVIGHVRAEPVRRPMDENARRERMNRMWADATELVPGDMAATYLAGRSVLPGEVPSCLRFHAACDAPDGKRYPAMLALVHGPDGHPATIHRTFLGPNGKAAIDTPRALMPGEVPEGSAVRLYPVHGERLGIAEGIETAIAAAKRFRVPVWAALNATMLAKWQPPAGVTSVVVFGDNDPAFGGQAAAYALAHRLAARLRLSVEVMIPQATGRDWADADAA
ncbi:MAG: hypothetical protein RL268_159 [Pseudomonadota bacterium]|jgi:putative DNA primase/helicase